MPEAAVGYIDDVATNLPHPFVAETPALQHALGEVLANHVGDFDQASEDVLRSLVAQVQRDAVLAGIVVVEGAASIEPALAILVGRPAAQDVPAALPHRVFDANHFGTEGR